MVVESLPGAVGGDGLVGSPGPDVRLVDVDAQETHGDPGRPPAQLPAEHPAGGGDLGQAAGAGAAPGQGETSYQVQLEREGVRSDLSPQSSPEAPQSRPPAAGRT